HLHPPAADDCIARASFTHTHPRTRSPAGKRLHCAPDTHTPGRTRHSHFLSTVARRCQRCQTFPHLPDMRQRTMLHLGKAPRKGATPASVTAVTRTSRRRNPVRAARSFTPASVTFVPTRPSSRRPVRAVSAFTSASGN